MSSTQKQVPGASPERCQNPVGGTDLGGPAEDDCRQETDTRGGRRGRIDGKVALITGAARGQGRSHAVRLAEEGADIIGVDLPPATAYAGVSYAMAADEDLAETTRLVEATGRRMISATADVRDQAQLEAAVAAGFAAFGRIDIVAANVGLIGSGEVAWEIPDERWQESFDVNVTGVWRTVRATAPYLIDGGRGGSIVITSSTAGLRASPRAAAYTASKHAVVGLMRTLAMELAPHHVRVNCIHPTAVASEMIFSESRRRRFRPDLPDPTVEDLAEVFTPLHLLPVPWLEPIDVSNALLWLVSDEARYVTGVSLPVDAGASIK
ncbi:MAG: mycofactocin-coupled SDR family oxidoreductase [Nocardioidaceae bacterium]